MHIAHGGHLFTFVNVLQSEAWLGNNITHAPLGPFGSRVYSSWIPRRGILQNIRMHLYSPDLAQAQGRIAAGRNCN